MTLQTGLDKKLDAFALEDSKELNRFNKKVNGIMDRCSVVALRLGSLSISIELPYFRRYATVKAFGITSASGTAD